MTEAEIWQAHREIHKRLIALHEEIAAKAMEVGAHQNFIENTPSITEDERRIHFDQLRGLATTIEDLDCKLGAGRAELRRVQQALLLLGFELQVDNDN